MRLRLWTQPFGLEHCNKRISAINVWTLRVLNAANADGTRHFNISPSFLALFEISISSSLWTAGKLRFLPAVEMTAKIISFHVIPAQKRASLFRIAGFPPARAWYKTAIKVLWIAFKTQLKPVTDFMRCLSWKSWADMRHRFSSASCMEWKVLFLNPAFPRIYSYTCSAGFTCGE